MKESKTISQIKVFKRWAKCEPAQAPPIPSCCRLRMPGVEPGSQAWEACMMPLHYMRACMSCALMAPNGTQAGARAGPRASPRAGRRPCRGVPCQTRRAPRRKRRDWAVGERFHSILLYAKHVSLFLNSNHTFICQVLRQRRQGRRGAHSRTSMSETVKATTQKENPPAILRFNQKGTLTPFADSRQLRQVKLSKRHNWL